MTPDIETLIERLDELVKRQEMGHNERFEHLAALFYQQTGHLAPGKSTPLEMSSEHEEQAREAAWAVWLEADIAASKQAIAGARDALRAVQWRPISDAPKDGTEVVVWNPFQPNIMRRASFSCGEWRSRLGTALTYVPELFIVLPLPTPRASKEG